MSEWTRVSYMGSERLKYDSGSGILAHSHYQEVVEAFRPSEENGYASPDRLISTVKISFSRFAEPAEPHRFLHRINQISTFWNRPLRKHVCLQIHCDPKKKVHLTCRKILHHEWFTHWDGNCATIHLANHLCLEVARRVAKKRGLIPKLCIERAIRVPDNELEDCTYRVFFSIDVPQVGSFGERLAVIAGLITANVEDNSHVLEHFKPWHYWRLVHDIRPIDITAPPWSYVAISTAECLPDCGQDTGYG